MSHDPEDMGKEPAQDAQEHSDERQLARRDFFVSLGTWSKVVIGSILLGGMAASPKEANAVIERRLVNQYDNCGNCPQFWYHAAQ